MNTNLYNHIDELLALGEAGPLQEKLNFLHNMLQMQHPFIERVAIALYDAKSDLLKTFVYSSRLESPLKQYQAKLSEAESLKEIVLLKKPRVVNDLSIFLDSEQRHAQAIGEAGYRASYTLPMLQNGEFFGFIFFNSMESNVFDEHVLHDLDMVGHMLMLLVYNESSHIKTMQATVHSALNITHERDPETGAHLGRMSRYARLIAQRLASKYGFNDDYIEHIFLFSPLHDLGKIAIPDRILLKAGKLTDDEFEVMKTHSQRGKELIDQLLSNYGLDGVAYVDMLRNIAMHHHEAIDGSGYPVGLKANDIPIEARIVAVADVFDALTSDRPYKKAWSNDAAFEALQGMAGVKLDGECVEALVSSVDEIIEIQRVYSEDQYG